MVQWSQYFTPRVRQLAGYCAVTFFIGFGSCTAMYRYAQVKVVTAPHCKEALDILMSHKDAVDSLGPPIGLHARFNFADRKSYRVDDQKKTFWMKLPLEGKLDTGHVYVDGVYESDDKFQVTKMELRLDRLEKRFRIFELDDADILYGKKNISTTIQTASKPSEEDEDDDVELNEAVARNERRKWFDPSWFFNQKDSKVVA